MTLESIVAEIYSAAGEPPDLEYRDPGTLAIIPTSTNWISLVNLVNEAQAAIATWTHQDGRRMRMRLTEEVARLRTLRVTATVADLTGSVLTLNENSGIRDYYRNWLLTDAAGNTALVFMSYVAGGDVLMLSDYAGTLAVGATVTLSKRSYMFGDVAADIPPYEDGYIWADYSYGRPIEIVGVFSSDGSELSLALEQDKKPVVSATAGQPTEYTKTQLGLRFDTYPDATYEYFVRFMRLPRPLGTTDALLEPEIPPQFHRSLTLYGLWWLFIKSQEVDKAYAVRRNFEDMLKRTQTEYDLQDRTQRGQITLVGEEA